MGRIGDLPRAGPFSVSARQSAAEKAGAVFVGESEGDPKDRPDEQTPDGRRNGRRVCQACSHFPVGTAGLPGQETFEAPTEERSGRLQRNLASVRKISEDKPDRLRVVFQEIQDAEGHLVGRWERIAGSRGGEEGEP